jgi:hypothetical protein
MQPLYHPGRNGYSRDQARMGVIKGDKTYLYYYPSAAAVEVAAEWDDGAAVSWELDDYTSRPIALHLTPALDGLGLKLRAQNGGRPFFSVPTSAVGRVVYARPQAVEEVEVSPSLITVRVPFEFEPRQ